MSRVLLILAVTVLLALPMLSARGRPGAAPARSSVTKADLICLGHGGVHATTRRLVTCYDGALHRWDGSHVRRKVPVLTGG